MARYLIKPIGGRKPQEVSATDEADAKRKYHERYPGWDGTIWSVTPLAEDEDDAEEAE